MVVAYWYRPGPSALHQTRRPGHLRPQTPSRRAIGGLSGAGRRCTVPTVLTDKPVEPMLILSS